MPQARFAGIGRSGCFVATYYDTPGLDRAAALAKAYTLHIADGQLSLPSLFCDTFEQRLADAWAIHP
jgi:hypothetical protein